MGQIVHLSAVSRDFHVNDVGLRLEGSEVRGGISNKWWDLNSDVGGRMKCKQQIGLYATRRVRYCHGKSSVRLSVVTLRYRDYIGWNTSKLISWLISLGFLLQRPWMTLKVIMHTASKHM